jgi:ABC-2 type transport system permease protein
MAWREMSAPVEKSFGGPVRWLATIWVIFKRELLTYFYTPLGWVVLAGFLLLTGVFFNFRFQMMASADAMSGVLDDLQGLILLVTPLIAMRLLAEEKRTGTLEMLGTVPVTDTQIVLGKYIGAMTFFCTLLAPSLAFVVVLFNLGNPEPGMLILGYVGVILTVGVLMAIGLFISALTRNQIAAGAITFVVFMGMMAFQFLIGSVWQLDKPWDRIVAYASIFTHYASFAKGVLDSVDLVYFVSLIVLFLFLAVRALDARRWK